MSSDKPWGEILDEMDHEAKSLPATLPILTADDIKVIIASARKIAADANTIKHEALRRDLTIEAAAILTLCEAALPR